MLEKPVRSEATLHKSISTIEERADRAAEEWFESHSRPPPLKKHLQASIRQRRIARARAAADAADALAKR
jgi:hypothetical protein